MAKMLPNSFPFGTCTGKIGDVVVRRRGNKYYVASVPVITKPPTKKQLAQRERFKKAIEYAKKATHEDSPIREVYEMLAKWKDRNPMNVAVSDYFNVPEIEEVDLSEYQGMVGDRITVFAFKEKTLVDRVTVVILDEDGNEVERGEAMEDPAVPTIWTFIASSPVVTRNAVVVVTATDLPGNTVEQRVEKTLED